MSDESKHIAVSGYYGFDNFGDEAILNVLTKELKKNNFYVTVFSKNPQKTGFNLGVNSVYTFNIKSIIKILKNCDVLISGGGSLLQDSTSLKSLLYYVFIILCAEFFKKDVIIFAQGIGPIKNVFGKFLTKIALKKCEYITVRDEKSLFLLRSWKLDPELVSDPVWNIETNTYTPLGRIGIQLRSWKGLTHKFLFNLANKVVEQFSDKEIYIYSFQDALDLDICKHFEAQLKLLKPNIKTKLINAISIDATIESFANLDYLIGMRYHACLLALKYGIPTLALSYDIKVKKLAEKFDLPCSELREEEDLEQLFNSLASIQTKTIQNKAVECVFDFKKILDKLND